MLEKIRRLYQSQRISYEWCEVEDLVVRDPKLFERCLQRACKSKYVKSSPGSENYTLWIACNLASNIYKAPRCYYCDKQFSIDDFLGGGIHLEHFIPRSKGGCHDTGNTNLACKNCNKTKGDLSDNDFRRILETPDEFFQTCKMSELDRKKLKDFAEIYLPKIGGLSEYAERNNIDSLYIRAHWDESRKRYRQRWSIDSR